MLLKAIKKIVYTGKRNNLHAKHKQAMAHISVMSLQQEKYQDIQDFQDQNMGHRYNDSKTVLTTKGITNPTNEQLIAC